MKAQPKNLFFKTLRQLNGQREGNAIIKQVRSLEQVIRLPAFEKTEIRGQVCPQGFLPP
ncbi:hypothetical protein PB1_06377 [Bacillus methanolicus PB1]|uniref:Uncharacterized protein n=1 Tax=Bacillus methanolicus PB1 TaxID=997296 RepID=I3E0E6_BACMT|nr:hypothetical protein PB1_06377 [Bacillus methanolicus PB1]